MSKWETNKYNEELAKTINNNNKFKDGDYLTSSNLNSIVEGILELTKKFNSNNTMRNLLVSKYFEDLQIKGSDSNWSQTSENLQTFSVMFDECPIKLYAKAFIDTNDINCTVDNTGSILSIKFEETNALRESASNVSTSYVYEIELYSDSDCTELLHTLSGTIVYYYESTTSSSD